ncbi:hypothetical protein D9611_008722 [Ephemerocybe angulata]|uniref:Uncharacterized protein n=1 Tax=Ephemerocybe angulata TaxID=980116 RepID=A0A8H5CC82_9AGAR|nr:hypothetical protein D9611_008722 [Tulosesus angulatus]
MLFPLLVACLFFALPLSSAGPSNVTIDDSNTSVTFSGNWAQTLPGYDKSFNGTYKTAKTDPSAYAEFKFAGTAVYFISPRWPFPVSTRLTLDPGSPDARPLVLSLEDYKTRTVDPNFSLAMVLAGATGLENKEHTVRVDGGDNATYALFDAFIYTTLDSSDAPSAPTPTSSSAPAFTAYPTPFPLPEALEAATPSPTPMEVSAAKKPLNLAVIFAPLCSVMAVVFILGGVYLYRYEQKVRSPVASEARASSPDVEEKEIGLPTTPIYQLQLNLQK